MSVFGFFLSGKISKMAVCYVTNQCLLFLEKWQGHFSVFQGLGDYPNAYGNNCSERCFLWIGGFRKFGLFGVKFGDAVQYMRAKKNGQLYFRSIK